MVLTGGVVAEKILRNRGRSRNLVAELNLRILRRRLQAFLEGKWKPEAPIKSASYAISLTSVSYTHLTLPTIYSV